MLLPRSMFSIEGQICQIIAYRPTKYSKENSSKNTPIGLILNAACCCCNLISLHGSRTLQEDVTNAAEMTLTQLQDQNWNPQPPPPPTQISSKLTSVGDCKPSSQEVEGPVRGVSYVTWQRLKVALSRQPAHKLRGVRVEFAVMQSVRAVGKGVQQGPVGHRKLSCGIMAGAEGALVTGGGGGQIRLDGEQMGILCLNNKRGKALA